MENFKQLNAAEKKVQHEMERSCVKGGEGLDFWMLADRNPLALDAAHGSKLYLKVWKSRPSACWRSGEPEGNARNPGCMGWKSCRVRAEPRGLT